MSTAAHKLPIIADDLGEAYYYPDVFVACEPGDDASHVVNNPYQSNPFPPDVQRPWYHLED